jgi:PAS domain S-box-containing protein
MFPPWVHRLGYYGLALLFVAAAAVLRWSLPTVLGPTPFLAFYLAWVGAAAFGGLGPGLLATVASWLCLEVLYDYTPGQAIFNNSTELGRFLILMAGGLTVSLVAERMRQGRIREHRQTEELAEQTEELRTTNEELRANEQHLNLALTERKQAEEALQERNKFLNLVLESLTHPFYVVDAANYDIVIANTATGVKGPLVKAKCYFAAHGRSGPCPDKDADHPCPLMELRRTGQPTVVEHIHYNADGQPRNVEVHAYPLFDAEGRVAQIIEYCLDITERKRAEKSLQEVNEELQAQTEELQAQAEELQTQTEELRIQAEELRAQSKELTDTNAALRHSERRYRSFIEVTSQWAWVTDANGLVVEDIPALRSFTGQTYEQAKGSGWAAALHPDDVPRTLEVWQHAVATRTQYETEYRMQRYDGVYRLLLARGVPILNEQGNVIEWVGTCIDITERKRAEETLRELNVTLESKVAQRTAELERRAKQLQKLTLELSQVEDRECKRMAEILHDDLQQIIAGAKFHLGLLRNRVKYDVSVQAIVTQIDQMLKDAVEKSRSLSHELSPAVLHHGDLKETLGWLAGQVQAKHGLAVHVHAHGQPRLQSDAIRNFLFRAAQELLFNVVKHARVKEAKVRVRRCGQCVCVSVSDRGRGFNPQELRETAGFGLLSIQERLELLGGHMRIKSVPGKGSTFFLVVPDREAASAGSEVETTSTSRAREAERPARKGKGRLRVLLADDHRIVREGLRSLLCEQYDVEIVGEAVHGREAVDMALRLTPDVVIIDMSMPLISGDEATRQIKACLPQTRVIAFSTYNEPEIVEKMHRAGAESYVLKTASSDELLVAIRGKEPTS